MKAPRLLPLALGMFMFTCSTVEKTDEPREGEIISSEIVSNPALSAKISGHSMVAEERTSFAQKIITDAFTSLNLMGNSIKGEGISIRIGNYKGAGTYSIGFSQTNKENPYPTLAIYATTHTTDAPNSHTWSADKGQVTITEESNGRVKGTFSFSSQNDENVSEGRFDLKVK